MTTNCGNKTHFDMGKITAISRQTVATIRHELGEQVFINFDRQSILIHHPTILSA
jgi:hypothetical protein